MKTIGLIGGMSWESSLEYYRIINEYIKEKLGGMHSAKCFINSVDFADIEELQHKNQWLELSELMLDAASKLENAGSDFIVICTNTMHKTADYVQSNISIPILHIADSTARKINELKIRTVALLGTKFTMEQDFYKGRLKEKFGINVIIPDDNDRQIVHNIIYNELVLGIIKESSRKQFISIINKLKAEGAEGVILGCTEIPLLIKQNDSPIPIFDTTEIHAKAAVEFALGNITHPMTPSNRMSF